MNIEAGTLNDLVGALRARAELGYKRDVRLPARAFGRDTVSPWFPETGAIRNGDDAAALPLAPTGAPGASPAEHLLFAAEGIRGELVASDPWFAGYASILANVNDIAAMGGRPWAVVDVLFLGSGDNEQLLEGMRAASEAYGVPVVGGHTTRVTGPTMVAVSVVGRARRVLASDAALPGQALVVAIDLGGTFRGSGGNFDGATKTKGSTLRARVEALPSLAESGFACAAKDISMAGLCGTLVMMLEAAGCGATLDLARVPAPAGVQAERWLTAFPSFGFVLSAPPEAAAAVCARFDAVGVTASVVGQIDPIPRLELQHEGERATYWDLREEPLTGFGA
jgi:AIR synthase-related protein